MADRRSPYRLCHCGTTIHGGRFCDTCYGNTTLRERLYRGWREHQQPRKAWQKSGVSDG